MVTNADIRSVGLDPALFSEIADLLTFQHRRAGPRWLQAWLRRERPEVSGEQRSFILRALFPGVRADAP
jgi:hypothetical protein